MTIEIANRLQKLRKQNNLSQEELAAKIGVSRQAVSKWERAEASPDTDNLLLLAKLYNVSLDEMLRTEESIMNLNFGFRNEEQNEEQEKPVSKGISLKKEDYIRKEAPAVQEFTDIEIYPQKPSVASVPQGSPFNEEPVRVKNIAAEAPKSQFTTAQEFTAETKSDRIQDNSATSFNGSPYSNTGSAYRNSSNTSADPFSQMGVELGKIGKELGKGLGEMGKELGKLGKELGKQVDDGMKNSACSSNTAGSASAAPTYNYSYSYSTKKDTCKEKREQYREERRQERSCRHNCSKADKKPSNPAYAFPYPVIVTIAFFLAGFMLNLWHPAWMLFLTIPLYYTTIASIEKKNPAIFCYPVLTVIIFLLLGFMFSSTWRWAWLIFLTIPMYYTWIGTYKKFKEYKDK
jgi:transcriptional regulator with XRE-family HTH domain